MHFRSECTYPGGKREQLLQHGAHSRGLETGLQVEVQVRLALLALLVDKEDRGVLGELGGGEPLHDALLGLEPGRLGKISTTKVLQGDTTNILISHFEYAKLKCLALSGAFYLIKEIDFRVSGDGNFLFFDWSIKKSMVSRVSQFVTRAQRHATKKS